MKDFQNFLLPLTKPFEINSELTAINSLTSLTLLKSSRTADTSQSITPPNFTHPQSKFLPHKTMKLARVLNNF